MSPTESDEGKKFGIRGHLVVSEVDIADILVRGNVEIALAIHAAPDPASLTMLAAIERAAIGAVRIR